MFRILVPHEHARRLASQPLGLRALVAEADMAVTLAGQTLPVAEADPQSTGGVHQRIVGDHELSRLERRR
jgi:hypothetical protein